MTEEKSKVEKSAREIMAERKEAQEKSEKETVKDSPKLSADPTAEKTNDSKAPPKGSNWSLRILLLLIVFIIGAGGTIYALPLIKDRFPIVAKWVGDTPAATDVTAQISTLENRLAKQETELDTVKQSLSSLEQATDNLSSLTDVAQTDDTNDMSEKQNEILARLDKLEQIKVQSDKVEDDMSQSARIDMLLNRMSQLEASFVPLSKGLADAQDARAERSNLLENDQSQAELLSQIDGRLSTVENYAARDNNGALLAFRISALRQKVTSGEPYGPEVLALQAMMEDGSMAFNGKLKDALAWFSQHQDGITPREKLRDQLGDLIPAMIRAESSLPDDPWWKRAFNSTRHLITVRKTARSEDISSLDDMISGAQKMLNRFDLTEALSLLQALPDNIREVIDIWIMQAEIYLQANEKLDQIETLTAAYYMAPKNISPTPKPIQPETDQKNSHSGEGTSL